MKSIVLEEVDNLTTEQLNLFLDIGILLVVLINAFFLLRNSKKLKRLNKRLEILASIKLE